MASSGKLSGRWTRLQNRIAARRAASGPPPTAFVSQPEPRSIGSFARGRQLCAGNFLFSGHLLQDPEADMWSLSPPDHKFAEALHGFGWLDDLAAVGDARARARAQDWVFGWIALYGKGRGPGWTPDLTGRRLIRWISHGFFLMSGRDSSDSKRFLAMLAAQTVFLSRRWRASAPGLPRFEALTGLIYASISLEGMGAHLEPAITALDHECTRQIDSQGGLQTRNPEELLEVFALLTWVAVALGETQHQVSEAHWQAIERIAPTLRALRHADGGLARFHGGGRGLEGRLDSALAGSGVKTRPSDGLSMGFARLSAGRTSLVIDAAPPPEGEASADAHASTLAFELTSGRRPLVVNCGSGANFGLEWRRAGRATPSHSTLVLDERSSAQVTPDRDGLEYLTNAPTSVPVELSNAPDGLRFEGGHNGYVAEYGLTHVRRLELTLDGRAVAGEDMLFALDDRDRARFDAALDDSDLQGVPFAIRFHLHPDVDVSLDMGGHAVSMALMSGEVWILRTGSDAEITIQPSVYLEKTRLKPRASKQIVLSGRAMEYATRIRWSLAKPQSAPVATRDYVQDPHDATMDDDL